MAFDRTAKVKGILMFDAQAERLIEAFLNQVTEDELKRIFEEMGITNRFQKATALGLVDACRELHAQGAETLFSGLDKLDGMDNFSEKLVEMCIHFLRFRVHASLDQVLHVKRVDKSLH